MVKQVQYLQFSEYEVATCLCHPVQKNRLVTRRPSLSQAGAAVHSLHLRLHTFILIRRHHFQTCIHSYLSRYSSYSSFTEAQLFQCYYFSLKKEKEKRTIRLGLRTALGEDAAVFLFGNCAKNRTDCVNLERPASFMKSSITFSLNVCKCGGWWVLEGLESHRMAPA